MIELGSREKHSSDTYSERKCNIGLSPSRIPEHQQTHRCQYIHRSEIRNQHENQVTNARNDQKSNIPRQFIHDRSFSQQPRSQEKDKSQLKKLSWLNIGKS
jgi:hypothetical protein